MGKLYNIKLEEANLLKVSFGEPASNNLIVKEVSRTLDIEIVPNIEHGIPVRINGPASLPIAACIAHKVCHLTQAVACFDPKLGAYVVSIAHGPGYKIGDLIE
jgi:CRISPR-associated protein Csx3